MKAYIQRIAGQIPDDWLFSAMMGFKNKGAEIVFFEEEDIDLIPCTGEEVVVAYIEPTLEYFRLNNIKVGKPLNIPEQLHQTQYLHRSVTHTTMGELKADASKVNIFVKPADRVKGFSSGVISQHSLKPFVFADVDDSTGVMCSTPIDFLSEYRCFIHNGEIKGIQYYVGDFTVFPQDTEKIKRMIKDYLDAPIAYTLDIGVVRSSDRALPNKTILVECNDMWSVAHYGLRDHIYSTLLRDRWFQLIKEGKDASSNTEGTSTVG